MSEVNQKIIEKMKQATELRILVLGDVMLDEYEFCFSKHSKEIPSEKLGKKAYVMTEQLQSLGGAANVAANLTSLGCQSVLCGLVGIDGNAFTVKRLAKEAGINCYWLEDDSRPTTTKSRIYVDNEYLMRRDDEKDHALSDNFSTRIQAYMQIALNDIKAVIFSDYNKGFFTKELAQSLIQDIKAKNIPIVVDFKPQNKDFFRGANVIIPNALEAKELLPEFNIEGALEDSLKKLQFSLGAQNVLVTLGAKGMCGVEDGRFFLSPSPEVTAVDAVGCGDTVRSGIALGLSLGLSLEESAVLANHAAAVAVQKIGTTTVRPQELIDSLGG